MDEFKMIYRHDYESFYIECDALWKDGWRPLFQHVVTEITTDHMVDKDTHHVLYTQQWYKPKTQGR
jgi:hypothetical protein